MFRSALLGLALLATAPISAAAQDLELPEVQSYALFGFHVEGTTLGSFPIPEIPAPEATSGHGFEGAVGINDRLHRFFAVGGRLSVILTDAAVAGEEGSLATFSLSFAPRLILPLSVVDFYASPVFGVGLTTAPADDFDLGEGYHVDLLLGAALSLGTRLDLMVEGGWSSHWSTFPTTITDLEGMPQTVGLTMRIQRFLVRAGLAYTF